MRESQDSSEAVAKFCAKVLDENKLEDIKVYDVERALQFADYFVVATGKNPRHLKAATDELSRELQKGQVKCWGVEGYRDARWILIDMVDVVVHLFVEEAREYYDLDNLWGDCPRLPWTSGVHHRIGVSGRDTVEGR